MPGVLRYVDILKVHSITSIRSRSQGEVGKLGMYGPYQFSSSLPVACGSDMHQRSAVRFRYTTSPAAQRSSALCEEGLGRLGWAGLGWRFREGRAVGSTAYPHAAG